MLQSQENQPQLFPLAAGVAVPECIGAHAARGEKPRLGLSSLTTASHLGFAVCNSTTALGLRAGWVETRSGAYRCARYYDPTTGRFISEDPLRFLSGKSGKDNCVYVLNRQFRLLMFVRHALRLLGGGTRSRKTSLAFTAGTGQWGAAS